MYGLTIDANMALRELSIFAKVFPVAVADGMNLAGEYANSVFRPQLPQRFHIRDRRLIELVAPTRLPKDQRANKNALNVILLPRDANKVSGRILNPYQEGAPHVGKSAEAPVAIPTRELRPTDMTVVPPKWFPVNLGYSKKKVGSGELTYALGRGSIKKGLTPYHTTKSGKVQIKGKDRTFVLDPRYHDGITMRQWGVYQRIGPEPSDIRMLWRFKREVPRPPVLQFYQTVIPAFMGYFPRAFEAALAHNIRVAGQPWRNYKGTR